MGKSIIKVFLIAAMLVVGATYSLPAWAQSAEIMATFKQYQALNKQGKYSEAVPFAKTFIELVVWDQIRIEMLDLFLYLCQNNK